MKRKVVNTFPALYNPIADLVTRTPIPQRKLEQVDPFIFLNHHGPQVYPPGNHGLPFGPHPHRGMETVTFILEGDLMHSDSSGHESIMRAGGVQWMTAGRGIIHAEVSSEQFKKEGGPLEILQLWINLPARLKMTAPSYKGIESSGIPVLKAEGTAISVISGELNGTRGAFNPLRDIHLALIRIKQGSGFATSISANRNILFYVISGNVNVNDTEVPQHHLAVFEQTGEEVAIEAPADALILFGHADPLNEPMVARGPFVMNTEEEIQQAYRDYEAGHFGKDQ